MKELLSTKFKMNDLGKVFYYLVVQILQNQTRQSISAKQFTLKALLNTLAWKCANLQTCT